MPLTDAELYDKIRRTVTNKHELQVLESFLIFNKCVFLTHDSTFKIWEILTKTAAGTS